MPSSSRLAIALFIIQMAVPFLLIGDVVIAWRFPTDLDSLNPSLRWWSGFGTTGQFVFAFSSIWLVASLLLLTLGIRLHLFKFERLYGPLISIYTLIIVLSLVECGLQIARNSDPAAALWRPGPEAIIQADSKLMPGISGHSNFTGNDVGLRGPKFPRNEEIFKIITIGGSTTESLFLDDTEEWPHLIMDNINAKIQESSVWVANGGQSGRNTLDHLTLMQVLPVIKKADLLIFMIGLNDLQPTLSLDGASTEDLLRLNTSLFRKQVAQGGGRLRPSRPYFKRLEVFELLKRSSIGLIDDIKPGSVLNRISVGPGSFTAEKRKQRAESTVASLPDLNLGVQEYTARIRLISAECNAQRIRCLYVTQPSMWRHDLPKYEQSLMWFGWVKNTENTSGYLTISDLEIAMNVYNNALLNLCSKEQLECLDLAAKVPKDTTAFYDDVHFNESGAQIVATAISDYLLQQAPFMISAP